VPIDLLTRNPSVAGDDLYDLKAHGGMGVGIAALAGMIARFTHPVLSWPSYDGMAYSLFWNRYPDDFEDENNLSLVAVMRWPGAGGLAGFSILYGGDMERAGWLRLLDRAEFRREMQNINVFVASHHGRFNGNCGELFEWTGLRPDLFVISDCGIQHATQETLALYRQYATGIHHNYQFRRVVTTRRDGWIRFAIENGRALLTTSR
jgi:hypothetical protein